MRRAAELLFDSASGTLVLVAGVGVAGALALAWAVSLSHGSWIIAGALVSVASVATLALAARLVGRQFAGTRAVPVWLLAAGLVLWGSAQLLNAVVLFDEALRVEGYRWKNLLGAGIVVAMAARALARHLAGGERWSRAAVGRCALALLFPAFASLTLTVRGEFQFALVAMYALWGLYAFVLVPGLTASPQRWRLFVGLAWGGTWLVLAGGIAWGVAIGQWTWIWTDRYAFVFALVPYALGVETAGILGLALAITTERRGPRLVCLGSVGVALVLLAAAVSRGATLSLGVTIALYLLLRSRARGGRLALGLAALLVAVVGAVQFIDLGADRIDTWSSGRLTLFDTQVDQYLEGHTTADWLFGSTAFLQDERTLETTDEVSEGARYARNNTDNAYLTLLLNHGWIGLATFLLPMGLTTLDLCRRLRSADPLVVRRASLGLGSIAGLAAQSLVSMTVPSMGNVLAIYLPLLWYAGADSAAASR